MARKKGARQPPEFLVVGYIVRPHGVRGGLLVRQVSGLLHALGPQARIFLGPEKAPGVVRSLSQHRERYLLYLEGCEDRQAADAYRDQAVSIRFDDAAPLPEHVYYHWQIIGLEVKTEAGELLGKVVEILETGANDVYVVRNESGEEILLPAVESVVLEIDLEQECMLVHLLPGLRQ
jgi:16S rRNA processing protein RimM